MLTADQILSSARAMVRTKEPYMVHAVYALMPREAEGLGTFGVTKRLVMYYDPNLLLFWQKAYGTQLAVEYTAFAYAHEVAHPFRHHRDRRIAGGFVPERWNHAADREINDDLRAAGYKCPPGFGLFPQDIGCEDGQTAEFYYAKARQQEQEEQDGDGEGSSGDGDEDGNGDDNGESNENEEGANGSDGGDGDGDEDGQGKGGGKGAPKPKYGPGQCGSGAGGREWSEEQADGDGEGRSDAEIQSARVSTANAIQKHIAQHGRGSVPAGWARWAAETLQPPKVRWQDKLRRATRGAVAYVRGMTEWAYDRPPKRQAAMGYSSHSPILPRTRSPLPRVAVVVDTSGSMGNDELRRAASETKAVLSAVHGDVLFCENDAAVHDLKPIKDVRQIEMKGGGGTSFIPPFQALHHARPRPTVVIFITDGCGPAPESPPKGMRVIWVLVGPWKQRPTPPNHSGHISWGEFIEVDEDETDNAAA